MIWDITNKWTFKVITTSTSSKRRADTTRDCNRCTMTLKLGTSSKIIREQNLMRGFLGSRHVQERQRRRKILGNHCGSFIKSTMTTSKAHQMLIKWSTTTLITTKSTLRQWQSKPLKTRMAILSCRIITLRSTGCLGEKLSKKLEKTWNSQERCLEGDAWISWIREAQRLWRWRWGWFEKRRRAHTQNVSSEKQKQP